MTWPEEKKARVSAVLTSDFTSDDERIHEEGAVQPYRLARRLQWESHELRSVKSDLDAAERTIVRNKRGSMRMEVKYHSSEWDKRGVPPPGAPDWTIR